MIKERVRDRSALSDGWGRLSCSLGEPRETALRPHLPLSRGRSGGGSASKPGAHVRGLCVSSGSNLPWELGGSIVPPRSPVGAAHRHDGRLLGRTCRSRTRADLRQMHHGSTLIAASVGQHPGAPISGFDSRSSSARRLPKRSLRTDARGQHPQTLPSMPLPRLRRSPAPPTRPPGRTRRNPWPVSCARCHPRERSPATALRPHRWR